MLDFRDEAHPEADARRAGRDIPELKAQAADAIFGSVPVQGRKNDSTPNGRPLFARLFRYAWKMALAACLFGLAWAGGSHYARRDASFDAEKPKPAAQMQQQAERAEILGTVRAMAQEIRALQTSLKARRSALSAAAPPAADRKALKRLDSLQIKTHAAIVDLAHRLAKLERDSATRLSKLSQQLDSLEHRIAARRAAAVSRRSPPREPTERRHDAFNPSLHPNAPGAPRSLGSLVNTY